MLCFYVIQLNYKAQRCEAYEVQHGKCKVLHLGQGNPHYQRRLGDDVVENSPAVNDMEVLVDERLDTS